MSGLTPPPSWKEPSVKREISTPPELLQESAADAMSNDALENQLLMEALEKELSSETVGHFPASNPDAEMPNALSCHEEDIDGERNCSPPQQRKVGTSAQPTPAERDVRVFPDDVSEFSDGKDGISDDESDGLFISQSPATPSSAHENSNQHEKSKKQRKSSGPRAKTAREWHKNRLSKLTPSQKRGPAVKRQELLMLFDKRRSSHRKRKSDKKFPRQKKVRVDPSIFLHGAPKDRQPDSESLSDSEPTELPKEATGSNKKQYWNDFLEQNHGIDMHKCRTDWRQMNEKSASFGLRQVTRIDERWQLKGMDTSKSTLSGFLIPDGQLTIYRAL